MTNGEGVSEEAQGLVIVALVAIDQANVVEGAAFARAIAYGYVNSLGLLVVGEGLLVLALVIVDLANADQNLGFASLVFDLAAER